MPHARKVRLIGESRKKDDRLDAQTLGRLQCARHESRESRRAESGTATALEPLLSAIAQLSERICEYNDRIEALAPNDSCGSRVKQKGKNSPKPFQEGKDKSQNAEFR